MVGVFLGGIALSAPVYWSRTAPERARRQAVRAWADGRPREAEAILRPLTGQGDLKAIVLLARLRLGQNRPDSAVRLLEARLQDLGDPDLDMLAVLAVAYEALGRSQEARAAHRTLLSHRPDDAVALAAFARLTYRHGELDEALVPYQRLRRLDPANPAWPQACGRIFLEIDRPAAAVPAFRDALRLASHDTSARFELAEAEFLAGDLQAALQDLGVLRQAQPQDPRVAAALGECLRALGRTDEASNLLDPFVNSPTADPRVLRLRAEIHFERRELSRAIELLEHCRAAEPHDWRVLYQLSLALERVGRHQDARAAAEQMREHQQMTLTRF
jgi:Flp pilus assembly protein TadD